MKSLYVSMAAVVAAVAALVGVMGLANGGRTLENHGELTPEEERVIVGKGTERSFSGKYWDHFEPGVYCCRGCGAELYRSGDKFKSGCGWPSFDDEIGGAVKRVPDADGRRTEIICSACGGHLGHVFTGEGFTEKDTRHCVNSISLVFVPEEAVDSESGRVIFAGGCFWGVEFWFEQEPGVISVTSGYTGGMTENPTYREVCGKKTGHAEAVEVVFDLEETSFEKLARLFFEIHDPTQRDGQGPDIGDQYRSAVFYVGDEQKSIAEQLVEQLKQKGHDVVTQITPASRFWPAEDYHQNYYRRQGNQPSCHRRTKRF